MTVSRETPTARSPPTSLDPEAIDATKPRLLGGAPSKQIRNDRVVLASDRKPHDAAEEKKKPAGRAPA